MNLVPRVCLWIMAELGLWSECFKAPNKEHEWVWWPLMPQVGRGGGCEGGSTVSSVGCPSVCHFYLSNLLLPLCFSKHIITSLQRILPHFYLKSQVELKVYPLWNNTIYPIFHLSSTEECLWSQFIVQPSFLAKVLRELTEDWLKVSGSWTSSEECLFARIDKRWLVFLVGSERSYFLLL